MRTWLRTLVVVFVMSLALPLFAQSTIESILASSSRPQADRDRDANRQPARVLEFLGIGPGDQVADLLMGGGYYTRILVPLVGSGGRVYAGNNAFYQQFFTEAAGALFAEPAFRGVQRIDGPVDALRLPAGQLDAAIMMLAYHDLLLGDEDRAAMNRSIFAALKPGGVFGIVDHAAAAGSGAAAVESMHRIDKQLIIDEVTAAGFVLAAEADFLGNPGDDHSVAIFDPSVQGRTDRFLLRFEKPR